MSEEKQELIKITEEAQKAVTKFANFDNVEEQISYAKYLIDSRLVNFSSPEGLVMAFNVGKALNVDYAIAASNMYAIDGKITLSVHLATALARKAGLDWEIVKDGEYIKNQQGAVTDIVTEIKFYRYNSKLDRIMINLMSYTWSDATKAQLSTKANWVKMPRNMLRARCLMEGIRFTASDAIMGIFYEVSEMADAKDIDYEIDSENNIVINKK